MVRQDLAEAARGDAPALRRAASGVESTIGELRGVVSELHPAVAEQLGLGPALNAVALDHARRHGFRLDLEVARDAAGGDDAVLLMLARELLANAGTHGRPSAVRVRLSRVGAQVVLEVEDDGCGFDERMRLDALRRGHIGLAAAKERVEALGGRFDIDTAPGRGTTVRASLPVNRERRRFRRVPAARGDRLPA